MMITFLDAVGIENLDDAAIAFLSQVPHSVEIDYPKDSLVQTLLVRNAKSYHVMYTPTPVYFCRRQSGVYRIETPRGIFEAQELKRIWQLAKAI